ncbi:MAG: thiazole biosynthesis protein [Chitinispirillaceae bacterium]|nr:thiazole biosynthesis protein [Chitinispirillaceae bacterium]
MKTTMQLEELTSKLILDSSCRFWSSLLTVDVAVVGAGPSGLTAAKYLADAGLHVAVFERHLSFGGGMWCGGMGHPFLVFESNASKILDDFKIRHVKTDGGPFLTANSVEAAACLAAGAMRAGADIVTATVVEDIIIRQDRVAGIVINGYAIEKAGLHIDPLGVSARSVIDATGHEASIVRIFNKKNPALAVPLCGEASMWAERGEEQLIENTKELFPGLYVSGMAANAVSGGYRMGALFGGMLLSGKKCAELIIKELSP